jgi:hypothetical protein
MDEKKVATLRSQVFYRKSGISINTPRAVTNDSRELEILCKRTKVKTGDMELRGTFYFVLDPPQYIIVNNPKVVAETSRFAAFFSVTVLNEVDSRKKI